MAVDQFYSMNLLLAFYLCSALSLSAGQPLKAVNLGDGTQFWLYSVKLQKYLSAENGGGNILVANRTKASDWETFQAKSEKLVTADYEGSAGWEDDNPSVFKLDILTNKMLRGEYQLTNGLGPERAPKVMRLGGGLLMIQTHQSLSLGDLWPHRTMLSNGHITYTQRFMHRNNGMKIIVDHHAVHGLQNGKDHSGTRDACVEWDDSNIPETVAVIDFLAARYGKNPSLAAIQLMNEPLAPHINLRTLEKFYKEGYDAVRKYTQNAYMMMSTRISTTSSNSELIPFAASKEFDRVAIDAHYYYIFADMFKNMTVQQTIDFVYNQTATDLGSLTINGSFSFVAGQSLKAVNLGGWLVIEGWMTPSLFSSIKQGDLLDGTQVWLYSNKLHKYLSPKNGGGNILVANRRKASDWETFRLWRINESTFNFRVFNKQFMGLENQGGGTNIVAVSNIPNNTENFQIIRNNKGKHRNLIKIKASNGLFLQAKSETQVTADYEGTAGWENDNPSVFKMIILADKKLRGDYQLTNGLGPERARKVMRDHWNNYITEKDFKFMSKKGLNAVRIPVGWWTAYDPNPPMPFVGGSLAALDNAFKWAQNTGMKVILDLHAIPHSQNGKEHSGTRDAFIEWDDSYIPETLAIIDFFAARYAKNPSLAAIELLNEPMAPFVNLSTVKKFYKQGYDVVRKYTQDTYVMFSTRINITTSTTEIVSFAGSEGFDRLIVDAHYYYSFFDLFKSMSLPQTIVYIYNQTATDLGYLNNSNFLSFVGEWTGEMYPTIAKNATKQDYQRFTQAQMDVFGRATYGWAFWSYKSPKRYWSFKWLIEKNIIKLN
ncbi:Glucan 1,3-beta-glucosidase [Quillaja saponaria]|uniref:Glucan 1,3-beta-glucosidase n=1 Tax=Quillaja saponaria TaxID=32244 RepID=A0AAD7LET1_QUISA|nr:Glucan 1,3-beta-glucosidase [Quillaja saponaria]